MCVCAHAAPSLLQPIIWGPTLELVLHLFNVSGKDNLHNLTCEAENQAGPGKEMVQLDIECKWKGRGAEGEEKEEEGVEKRRRRRKKHRLLKACELGTKLSGLMEVGLRAYWGCFSAAGRIDAGCNRKK